MKKSIISTLALMFFIIFFTVSCTIKTDKLDGATIYTTTYPINYITKYLYSDYGKIASIYPKDIDINEYKLTKKQLNNYAKGDLFIYNGLTSEKDLAKKLLNKNNDLLIIDVTYGLNIDNNSLELWLSPNNYLMLAKNLRKNLKDCVESTIISEAIDIKFNEFEERISVIDATLHSLGKKAIDNNNETIIVSNSAFKYLENYGFKVIALDDNMYQKESRLNKLKNSFKEKDYSYILTADIDEENETIKELKNDYNAKLIVVDTMSTTLEDDYFDLMTEYFDAIDRIVS